MLDSIQRPNFFPGQLVDYRDFNRLSRQADRSVALLCRSLFPGGGVVVDALDEFRPEPQQGLLVRLRPGLVLLPDGDAVSLREDRLVDLSAYRNSGTEALVVSVAKSVIGTDRFVDESDPSVEGYRTELVLPELRFTVGQAPHDAIELFRVVLAPNTTKLRLATDAEGWSSEPIAPENGEAVVDTRFRPRIVPQTYVPVPSALLIPLRTALFGIERAHRSLEKLYLCADPFRALEFLAQVHAEVLSRPFQPLRVSFLTAEFADRSCRYLELLREKLGAAGTKFDEESLFAAVKALEPFRVREVVPRYRSLEGLIPVRTALEQLVTFAESNYRRIGILEEALADVRHRRLAFDGRILLAGYVFSRVDRIAADDQDRFSVRAATTHLRSVTAPFGDGESHTEKGLFLAQGTVDLEVTVPDSSRLACLLLRQYLRRGTARVSYELNGKALNGVQDDGSAAANRWVHHGLVVPPEMLVPGRNRLRVVVENADLDFGFFEIAAYQSDSDAGRVVGGGTTT